MFNNPSIKKAYHILMNIFKLDQTPSIHVVFLLNDLYLNNLTSIYRELTSRPHCKVTVIACDRIGYDFSPGVSTAAISDMLRSANIDHEKDVNLQELKAKHANYIFTSNPYDMYIKPELHSKELSAIARLCHISYGASLIEWVGEYSFLAENPYIDECYRVFTESCLLFPENRKFIPIGYLKLDEYIYNGKLPKSFSMPAIAWKPRWTGKSDSHLADHLDYFIDLALTGDTLINLVLHPMLLVNIGKSVDGRLIKDKFQKLTQCTTVNLVDGHDFLDYVLGSDIFVSDISSTLAEFMSTGKPIIYTESALPLNQLGKKLIGACYTSYSASETSILVRELLNNSDPQKELRSKIFKHSFVNGLCQSAARSLVDYLESDHDRTAVDQRN